MGYRSREDRRVPKDTYLILSLFWGWLGLHKFYAGKKFAGFLYFIFCWTLIPLFISLFEFFIAIFKRKDYYGRIKV
jgi:TM2 domain-containing membrane protein YozV